jgi:hypothetical protein
MPTQPETLIAEAVAGIRRRGEQAEMLKLEAKLPGFGGYFRDSTGQLFAYMKRGSDIAPTLIRAVMHATYSARAEPVVREAMATAATAVILVGDFSVSELAAIHNGISFAELPIPGLVGVGISYRRNRVLAGFETQAALENDLKRFHLMGIAEHSIIAEVWGPLESTAT